MATEIIESNAPAGAVWRKCAFQINPYSYVENYAQELQASIKMNRPSTRL